MSVGHRRFRVTVDYGDDRVRTYAVWAFTVEDAERVGLDHVNGLLSVCATDDADEHDDSVFDDTLGADVKEGRVKLMHADVLWYPGDDLTPAGFVCFGRMSDGTVSFPLGHPRPFEKDRDAWKIAHRLRFDDENGFLTIVADERQPV